MEKIIKVSVSVMIWFGMWLFIAMITMVTNNTVNIVLMSTYDAVFDMFTVAMQFIIGWIPVVLYLKSRELSV